ncbi:hypothetical protein LRS06_09200 [Hymenobacter sp. J193]|uniref:hypothetical protein n=1 Tax=Hymenobacter sp. J193 TaxID=2898429 RepID=UPI002150B450|nr:hypothetical protein [Hymenobacter sp. J193]MCR5887952.1 hypothetical protein [Hymenobacter sp. J193]
MKKYPDALVPPPGLPAPANPPAWYRRWYAAGRCNRVFLLAFHLLLLVSVYTALYCFGLVHRLPTSQGLLSWDSNLYLSIAKEGYDDPGVGKNAFFPLYPYLWRYLGVGPVGISLLLTTCTMVGAAILARTFRLTGRQLLVAVSLPALVFTLVPYSEGLFYVWGALLLRGLHRRNLPLTLVGMLLCCLTRAATTLFLPAYVFAELLSWDSTERRRWLNLPAGLLVMGAVTATMMRIFYIKTGDALAFYHVQAKWEHIFREPIFPLQSSAGIDILWLDAVALLVTWLSAVACAVLGSWWLLHLLRVVQRPLPVISKAVLFSLGYATGTGFYIMMYQGGDLANINRYMLATPFAAVLLWQMWQLQPATKWPVAAVVAGCLAVALALGFPFRLESFLPYQAAWYFGLYTLYVLAYLFISKGTSPWYREIATGLYLVNLVVMAHLLDLFLAFIWLG